ncbi:hypothetical protein BASA60_007906 [Batrachochytrium salamandrivorans]|nr:hypothetical protein BASA60_007906 [Batrachochytrium salamandrivorans]
MSTYSIASGAGSAGGGSVSGSGTTTPLVFDQGRALDEALGVVKVQSYHMKRCLDTNKLMDALKHASTMLSELRTFSLTPKYYYELYMAIFDEIRHLSTYLYETHMSGRHHLSDLYELVQYAANIIPRLYLMITVGAVYMRVSKETFTVFRPKSHSVSSIGGDNEALPDAESPIEKRSDDQEVPPIKELMRDMLEMARGVQHPTRGLFLRYYLSGLTRDFLPDGQHLASPHGTIDDSIHFVLQNFIEMNKLWVRLQHQGHSREREKREVERRELRLLIGSNLVRLSQLENLNLIMYQESIMPHLLEEIVSCRDVIAQEYLMEVVIQVFPDDFHLRCLDMFLSATARLQRLFEVFWTQITELIKARPEFAFQDIIALLGSLANLSLNCYPDELAYIDMVLGIAKEKVQEALLADKSVLADAKTKSLLLQLLVGPVQTYHRNVLTILEFPSSSTRGNEPLPDGIVRSTCLGGNYTDLLFLQPYSIRRQVAHSFTTHALRAAVNDEFKISTIDGVNFLLGEIGTIMVRDQIDGGLFGAKPMPSFQPNQSDPTLSVDLRHGSGSNGMIESKSTDEADIPLDWEDAQEEQTYLAKMVHLLRAPDDCLEQEYRLLASARHHFGEGGDIRIRFTLPPLVIALIKLARKCYYSPVGSNYSVSSPSGLPADAAMGDDGIGGHTGRSLRHPRDIIPMVLKTIHETIASLSRAQEHFSDDDGYKPLFKDDYGGGSGGSVPRIGHGLMSPPDVSLRLYLMSAQIADDMRQEEMCYEFFVQALVVYEESISESKAQVSAITQIIGALYSTTVFGYENYETLITKCAVHCSRLLKRVDQCRGVVLVSHLFWATDENSGPDAPLGVGADPPRKREEGKPAYRDGKRVLECLQKALKIADSVMDPSVNVELFVEILERYIWFYDYKNETVTIKYLNSLIDLIQTNLGSNDGGDCDDTGVMHNLVSGGGVSGGPLSASGPSMSIFRERSRKVSPQTIVHFRNVMAYIRHKRDAEQSVLDSAAVVPGMSLGFAAGEAGGGRWGSIEISRT